MKNIYEVIFKEKGKKYFFCSDLDIKYGISVIVETEKGLQYAKVLNKVENVNIPENEIKSIQRIASKRDIILKIFVHFHRIFRKWMF